MDVKLGDASLLRNESFDLILANINKNVLLKDMHTYSQVLGKNGRIIFSGFYNTDLDDIKLEAGKNDLTFHSFREKNNWVAATFRKE